MSAFEDAARRILEEVDRQARVGNAYGVDTDATIFMREIHWSNKDGQVATGFTGNRHEREEMGRVFKLLCIDEISVPVFDVEPGSKLSKFFALEPDLAP